MSDSSVTNQDQSVGHVEDTVLVFDTTLRDGEQSPGATLNVDENSTSPDSYHDSGSTSVKPAFRSPPPATSKRCAASRKKSGR